MSKSLLRCPAPAKINLFLHVTGRRADGYHTLQTAFRLLDHGDWLDFHLREDGQIRRINEIPGVPAEQDLVVRAARLLQTRTGCKLGADIAIEKNLPMGGGLGGGSSDAATTLIALNRLWNTDTSRQELQEWSLELGADVPFFIFGQSAIAEGVGEALQVLPLPDAWYVVIEPPVSVPTIEIFRAKGLTRNTPICRITGSAVSNVLQQIRDTTRNDLQSVASGLYPEIQEALDALANFGASRMSGSGSCVFLECSSQQQAEAARDALKPDWKVWCASGMNEHPLKDWVKN